MVARWDVPYAPGTLKAVVMCKAEQAAMCLHETAGVPAGMRVICEEGFVRADRASVTRLAVIIVDAHGHMVPLTS